MEAVMLPVETEAQPEAAAEKPNSKLFQWSAEVHVGENAEICEESPCEDQAHFHAWVCLANPFQVRDIGDKARAAKARKIRAMRDAGGEGREASDSFVTLEAILEELAQGDLTVVMDELAEEAIAKELGVIYTELSEKEEFEHADQDSEELARQIRLPEDQRDKEEFERLQKSQEAFAAALEEEVGTRKKREIDALRALGPERLIDLLRTKRINESGTDAYLHTYYTWLMFIGSRDILDHNKRKYATLPDLKMAAPEIVRALRVKINELENAVGSGGGGSKN